MTTSIVFTFFGLLLAHSRNQCPFEHCVPYILGDGNCDLSCNNALCNFDSVVKTEEITNIELFRSSDCLVLCLLKGCTLKLLSNNECDSNCNNQECAYDLGVCGICSPKCFEDELLNGKCDKSSPCNSENCKWDLYQCGVCADGCFREDISKETCENDKCKNPSCYNVQGNPCSDHCNQNCLHSQINDGKCDINCLTSSCSMDGNDCDCSPGCTFLMNETECLGISDPCNNQACEFKWGKCGKCASGCFESMLNNSICDLECFTEKCSFDQTDCQCASDCFKILQGNKFLHMMPSVSPQSCYVPDCWFNIQDYNDDFTRRSIVLSTLMTNDYSFFNIHQLPVGCSENELKMFDSPNGPKCDVTSPCYSAKALWCMGRSKNSIANCLRAANDRCVVCEGFMVKDACAVGLESCPESTELNSNLTDLFSSSSSKTTWCTKSTAGSGNNPKIIYVGPSNVAKVSGEGSITKPYLSLYQAFASIEFRYSHIKLNPGVYVYQYNSSVSVQGSVFNPLFSTESQSLVLEGLNPDNPSVIYWTAGFSVGSSFDILKIAWKGKLTIKNVEFNGDKILSVGCEYGNLYVCYYCPVFYVYQSDNHKDDVIVNDKIDTIFYVFKNIHPLNLTKKCDNYSSTDFFTFSGKTSLINVTFSSFRNQFSTFIKSFSTLELENVKFLKMQPSEKGVLIEVSCLNDCPKVDFRYTTGLIEDLNYGYEISEYLKAGGFLRIKNIHSIQLIQIEFLFSIAYNNPSSLVISTLISATNFLGTFLIDRCTFRNLYVNTLIDIDTSTLIYSDPLPENDGSSKAYNQLHFQLSNSIFENIYTSSNFIRYSTKRITQNVKIYMVEFRSVSAAGSSIISLIFDGSLTKADTVGEWEKINGVIVNIRKRLVLLDSLFFLGVTTAEFIVYVYKNPNVIFENITVFYLYDGGQNSISTIFFNFQKNGKYMTIIPRNDQIGDLKCSGSFKMVECYNVNISRVSIEGNHCDYKYAPSGFLFEKIAGGLDINSLSFFNIITDSAIANLLSFYEITGPINILDTYIESVFNSDGSLIEFQKTQTINIKNIQLFQVNVNTTSPVSVSDFLSFTMTNSEAKNVINNFGDCGYLKFLTSGTNESTITLSNFIAEDFKVYGDSGIVMIDSLSGAESHNIYIKNVTFKRIKAYQGVFLYISRKLSIKNSWISSIRGSFNFNSFSMIYDSHTNGTLKLDDVEFSFDDQIVYPGIYAEYHGYGNQLEVNKFKVFSCTKAEQVFEITGRMIDATFIYFNDITVKNVSSNLEDKLAKTMKLNTVTLNASALDISLMSSAGDLINAGLYLKNGIFYNLTDSFLKLQNQGYFKCESCKIFNNSGTILSSKVGSYFNLIDCEIFNNIYKGSDCSLFDIDSKSDHKNIIQRTVIRDNKSIGGKLSQIIASNLLMIDAEYVNNFAEISAYSGILAYETDLYIKNTTFALTHGETLGSFIYFSLLGNLTVIESRFFNASSQIYGGAMTVERCISLVVNGCSFINNTSLKSGGAISSKTTFTNISNSFFENNQAMSGSDLYLSENSYLIKNSTFLKSRTFFYSQQFSILATGKSLSLDQVKVKDPEPLVSPVSCTGLEEVFIVNSLFSGTQGDVFGAGFFDGGSMHGTLVIQNSTFEKNFCTKSGAAMFVNDMSLVLNDSLITLNQASIDGGGIFYQAPECRTCEFNISGNTKILKNKAGRNGGAIKWSNYKPNIAANVVISNNSAESGNNTGSVPAYLGLKPGILAKKNSLDFDYVLEEVPPGQVINDPILVYLYDSEGNVITTDNSSELSLFSNEDQVIISGNKTFQASAGRFNVTGFILRAVPGSEVMLNAKTASISKKNIKNDDTDYKNSFTIKAVLRKCISGEAAELDACSICPEGKYLIKSRDSCKFCPTGGICPGGSEIWVKPGFYRVTNESEVLYSCELKESCLGNDKGYQSECLEGYTGITCSVCRKGYTKSGAGKCSKCPDQTLNALILVFILIAFIIISAILVKTTISTAFADKAKYSIYIKIFTNYLQLVFLTTQFELSWPSYVVKLFGAQKTAASASDYAFSLDCYKSNYYGEYNEGMYYEKMILYSILPIIIIIASSIAWSLIYCLVESTRVFKRELPLTIIIIYFLIHPNLVKFMFSNFSCKEFDQMGSFLRDNYAIKCWTFTHLKYSLSVSVPSIILWSLGIPTIVLIRMIKKRKRLYKDQNKVIYGFLCNGYKTSKYYWEFLIIYRKIIIICIIVFLSQVSNEVQALTVTLVLLLSIFLQYRLDPYNSKELNHMEMEALITATLTIYCGLYYLTNDIGESTKLLLFGFIVLGNSYFIFTWLYWISAAMIDAIVKVSPFLKYLCKKGDPYDEDFYVEKVQIPGTFYDEADGARKSTFIWNHDSSAADFKIFSMKYLYFSVFKQSIENQNRFYQDSRLTKSSSRPNSGILEEDDAVEQTTNEDHKATDSINRVEIEKSQIRDKLKKKKPSKEKNHSSKHQIDKEKNRSSKHQKKKKKLKFLIEDFDKHSFTRSIDQEDILLSDNEDS